MERDEILFKGIKVYTHQSLVIPQTENYLIKHPPNRLVEYVSDINQSPTISYPHLMYLLDTNEGPKQRHSLLKHLSSFSPY